MSATDTTSLTEIKLGTPSAKLGPAPGYIPPPPPWIAEAAADRTLSASDADISATSTVEQGATAAPPTVRCFPRATPEQVEIEIEDEAYFSTHDGASVTVSNAVADALKRITVCVLTLRNGTLVAGVNEGSMGPQGFDVSLGREMARRAAVEKIWPLVSRT